MKDIDTYHKRLDNWEWDDGHYVVIECNDEEEAKGLKEIIRALGLLSQEINK